MYSVRAFKIILRLMVALACGWFVALMTVSAIATVFAFEWTDFHLGLPILFWPFVSWGLYLLLGRLPLLKNRPTN